MTRPVTRRAAVAAGAALVAGRAAGRPAPPPIKVGQIGVGHAHAAKLAVYRASPDYEVVGVVEPDEGLRKRAEDQPAYRGLRWLTRDQLLDTPGLRAVLVETRVRDLLGHAEACVGAGVHVHVDKPAGESLAHLARVLAAAGRKKLMVQVGYMYRYNPAVVLLRDFLRRGWLGDVFEVHAVMSKVVDPAARRDLAAYPGGMMFELGCHVLDLVVGVLGKPAAVAPFHTPAAADGLRDNTLAVLTYPRATATVRSTALEVEGGGRRHLVVCGTEGTFHIQPLDDPAARVTLARDRDGYRKGTQAVAFPRYARYAADAADMARVIRGEKASDFPPAHDLAVQDTLLRACGLPG
jgi:predicted dehydrogenase